MSEAGRDYIVKRIGHGVFLVVAAVICLVADSLWPLAAFLVGAIAGTWEFRIELRATEAVGTARTDERPT
jgi:hypothetical protein